ncbi:hypothetical protein V4C53_39725, partial [Paraburkholderia azotifigens]|uniref:hypothetical protein n=1 Tax=Paraburkholderia azotifigens TaxID=2057004 RepID=UPI003170E008
HTYRLLVFKEHSQEAPCFHRVAASAAEKRDYEEPFSFRQPVFLTSQPADSTGKPVNAGSPALLRFSRAALSAARKTGILDTCISTCKRFLNNSINDV